MVKVPGVTMPLWYWGPYILAGFELSFLNGGLLGQGNMAIILPSEPGLIRLHHPGLNPSASLRHIAKYVDESLLESQYGT